ncbi:hypothetical protein M426DRAFT_325201 [Hypoxylon sp. CI-4A]|nr:hypothetical protein M426DRAFT_325201 [Hypoxylon sp. CI-4A]
MPVFRTTTTYHYYYLLCYCTVLVAQVPLHGCYIIVTDHLSRLVSTPRAAQVVCLMSGSQNSFPLPLTPFHRSLNRVFQVLQLRMCFVTFLHLARLRVELINFFSLSFLGDIV